MALPQGARHRDRVRDHGPQPGRLQPGAGLEQPSSTRTPAAGRGSSGRSTRSLRAATPAASASRNACRIELETGLVNVVLTNGARLYVDHAHPEYSTPECSDPLEAALYDKAGEVVMARAVAAAQSTARPDERDARPQEQQRRQGQLVRGPRELPARPESAVRRHRPPLHRVPRHPPDLHRLRQGRRENGRPAVDFQITQRADFFEEEVGLETTLKRPIINTRDEPHADHRQVPPTPRHHRRRQPLGDPDVPQARERRPDPRRPRGRGPPGRHRFARSGGGAVWQVSHDPALAAAHRAGRRRID